MKKCYVKILSGEQSSTMPADNWNKFILLVDAEESPGDGWYPVVKDMKILHPGPYQELWFTYTIKEDGYAHKTYSLKSTKVFSKLKVIENLMKEGLWTQAKAYIEQAGLYDLFLAAQNFREDNEFFEQGLAELKRQLGVSDEKVEEILSKSLVD